MSDNADKNLKVHVATTGDASAAKKVGNIEAKRAALVSLRQEMEGFKFYMDHLVSQEQVYKQAKAESSALLHQACHIAGNQP